MFVCDGIFLYNPITQALGVVRDYKISITIVAMNTQGHQVMLNRYRLNYSDGMMQETDPAYGFDITSPTFEDVGTLRVAKQVLEIAKTEIAAGGSTIINTIVPD